VLRHLDVGDKYTYAGGGESRDGSIREQGQVLELSFSFSFSFSSSRLSAEPFDP
jgi:hypothetical protein